MIETLTAQNGIVASVAAVDLAATSRIVVGLVLVLDDSVPVVVDAIVIDNDDAVVVGRHCHCHCHRHHRRRHYACCLAVR